MLSRPKFLGLFALSLVMVSPARAQVPGVEHVVIIGVDGLSPDGIRKAETPVLDRMMAEGASTLHARAVMPTVSSPNWASMIMGAGPEQHGVTSNDWRPDNFEIEPTAKGSAGIFPTIFGVLREQRPDAVIVCVHDWDGFGRLFERQAADAIDDADGPQDAASKAVGHLTARKPTFTFLHLDHVDHAGHEHGHGTPEYYRSVEEADRLIGEVLAGLESPGIRDRTLVIVTADHGGKGKGHGGNSMTEIEIPWIAAGAGVAKGRELRTPVSTMDTAATVAHALGLKPPASWVARPVREAFEVPMP